MIRITSWKGVATILGQQLAVSYREADGRLAISGVDAVLQKSILEALGADASALPADVSPAPAPVQSHKPVLAPMLPDVLPEVVKDVIPEAIHTDIQIPVPGAPVEALPVLPVADAAPVEAVAEEKPKARRGRPKAAQAEAQEPLPTPKAETGPRCPVDGRPLVQLETGGITCGTHYWRTQEDLDKGKNYLLKHEFEGASDPWQLAPPGEPVDEPPPPPPVAAPAPSKAAAKPYAEIAPEEPKKASSVALPDGLLADLQKANKLAEVLGKLIDAGYTKGSQLVQICTAVKADVPVLSRVPDLQDRIPRALGIMGHEG